MPTNDPSSRSAHLGHRAAVRVALIAGVFAAAICALLLLDYSRRLSKDPLNSPQFQSLKAELAKQPRDEKLKEAIRTLDLELREAYFRQRRFAAAGAWLLLGCVVVSLVAMKWAVTLNRKLPMPQSQIAPADTDSQLAGIARWSVAGLALVFAGSAMALSMGFRSQLPASPEPAVAKAPKAPPSADGKTGAKPEAIAQAASPAPEPVASATAGKARGVWPRFRGPEGTGVTTCKDLPTTWDATSGKGILWKTPVPLAGNNSPVVWNDRVFLTGATEDRREVYAFDADSGKLLWQGKVPGTPESTAEPPEVSEQTGFASSTAATDGQRVYAIFANGDVAAFDFAGKLAWARSLGVPKSAYGYATSLAMHENRLLVQIDQGSAKDKLSKLLALDSATGKTVWETPREVPNSWTTPIVIRTGDQAQLITCADPWVIAYDPAKGTEIWRAKCLRQDVGPSPTFAGGVLFVANEFPGITALKTDGRGDVTKTHVLWTAEDNLPDTCSPVATEEFLFTMASYGTLTCFDAKSGEMLWQEDFENTNFSSSPSLAGNRLYLFSEEGKTWLLEPNREGCKRIAEASLAEKTVASPAFQDTRIYIRGEKTLFCLGETK